MAKIEPFERYATKYEDWFTRHKFAYESELEAVRQHLPRNKKGIEIGVGTGRFAAPLGIKFGVEPSTRMREFARSRGIEVIGGVAEAIPLKDSTFDFALLVTTICFVDDLEASFREAYRILKPGACLIIGFIDRDSPMGKLYDKHKKDSVFYHVANFRSAGEVISVLEKTGFGGLAFSQTIFKDLSNADKVEPVKSGYGEGSFVVVRATK